MYDKWQFALFIDVSMETVNMHTNVGNYGILSLLCECKPHKIRDSKFSENLRTKKASYQRWSFHTCLLPHLGFTLENYDIPYIWLFLIDMHIYLKIIYKGFFKSFVALYADRICSEHHFVENRIENFLSV